GIIALYRAGSYLPTPGVQTSALKNFFGQGNNTILSVLNLFSGGALANLSLFALGIMPYITASIILQLMTVAVPALEQLQKEGEAGYKKITQYTRYLTVVLAALQAAGYVFLFHNGSALGASDLLPNLTVGRFLLIVATLTAGTALLMWMGELVTQRGIGNGMSLLIFASIMTSAGTAVNAWLNGGTLERLSLPIITIGILVSVVFVNEGQRRIPIQYAKRMVGRRMTSGGSTYMPLRVNMAGVIPVIFAVAVLFFPPTVGQLFPSGSAHSFARFMAPGGWPATIFEFVLVIAFTFFYTAVTFNPVDQAENLKKNGGFIPGVRPGRPTANYLDRVLTRLTFPGALFLGVIAILPNVLIREGGFSQATARGLGGTSILIVVGVALDIMRQMESQLTMRHYEGFLSK
ncbi:MAG: preprotein translocase subunit SecY, partial [Gaiellales bacterium]|nr:preprotein translocase subunit SecY [Gaiellales bacterium]